MCNKRRESERERKTIAHSPILNYIYIYFWSKFKQSKIITEIIIHIACHIKVMMISRPAWSEFKNASEWIIFGFFFRSSFLFFQHRKCEAFDRLRLFYWFTGPVLIVCKRFENYQQLVMIMAKKTKYTSMWCNWVLNLTIFIVVVVVICLVFLFLFLCLDSTIDCVWFVISFNV